MRKLDSSLLVCSADISQQLIGLGILPLSCFCYELVAGNWEYSSEYFDQSPVLPAFTMEELNTLIGGEFPEQIIPNVIQYPKPDLLRQSSWTPERNMLKYFLYLPKEGIETFNGAEAYAVLLYKLILAKKLDVKDCNERLEGFLTARYKNFNPLADALKNERK